MPPKFTLLTNIDFVQSDAWNGIRLHANALLLSQDPDPQSAIFGPNYSLRGFGTECYQEVFKVWLNAEHFPFTIGWPNANCRILFGEELKPIYQGAILSLGFHRFFLQYADISQPIDIFEHDEIDPIWQMLRRNVATYWQFPCIGYKHYVSTAAARAEQGSR